MKKSMQYAAHQRFVDPARARAQLWRLCVGILVVLLVYLIGIAFVMGATYLIGGSENFALWMTEFTTGTRPTGALLMLATFGGMFAGPIVAVWLLHRRKAGSLFGPAARLVRHFAIGTLICGLVYGLSFLIPDQTDLANNLDRALWLSFLPIALAGVLLQTGAEEVLFRGYIQQQLAARFRSPIVWMILPSLLFGALHWQPDSMGDNAIYIVAAASLFGILAADLTARTGTIGAAWGFHFANNCVAILLVSLDGPLSGLSLYLAPYSAADAAIRPLILLDMVTTFATWALIRVAVSRAG